MDNYKKTLYNEIEKWKENLHVLFTVEEDYKKSIIEKYQNTLNEAKIKFKEYGVAYNYKIIETKTFIDIIFSSNVLVLRMKFEDPFANESYSFELSIKDASTRNEYVVYIIPSLSNLQIPKWSITSNRPEPKTFEEANSGIKLLADEILQILAKKKELLNMNLYFAFHNAEYDNKNIKELKHFDCFSQIIIQLMSN